MQTECDIGIVGGGLVGSLAALLLSQQGLRVSLFDPNASQSIDNIPDLRVSAITPSSWNLLTAAGVIAHIDSKRLSKILSMHIFEDADNPVNFYASDVGQTELGFIIENNVLLQAIQKTFPENVTRIPKTVNSLSEIKAKLVILAQGGNSPLTTQLSIPYHTFAYQEEALVCHVESAQPHGHTAYQRFLPKPLAFLPLFNPHWSSIVWTLSPTDAVTLKTNPELLIQRLETAFPHLGKLKLLSKIASFPMYADRALQVSGHGFVLMGDAAHTVHPLAGQGVNLGFRDVAAFTKLVQNYDLKDPALLDAYSKATLKHNTRFSQGFSLIHYFYEAKPLTPLRRFATKALNRFIPIKRELIKLAMGKRFRP